ncbi:MAG: purine-nucleoside phosphorylase [Spirochaetaceae bacterium]|jgi:purine-nucleoside phosphorylase|nr:purine-nucleoside phosphorylase [Spirochaetaceae bacterium]
MTVHNRAAKGDIARVALMAGDPLRARWIAENFLEGAELVSDVRGMLVYTGLFEGKGVTVMGHGMGCPSMGIYSYELFGFYDVEAIVRVGSAGAYLPEVGVGDVVIARDVVSYSGYADEVGVAAPGNVLAGDGGLVAAAVAAAEGLGVRAAVRRAFCCDAFYNKYSLEENVARSMGAAVVEMEGFALYANARKLGKRALMLLTCSDSLVTGEALSAGERERSFGDMVRLGLAVAGGV